MTKSVYIAGPVTGLPDLNKPAFAAEALHWRGKGYLTINPHEVLITDNLPSDAETLWRFCMTHCLRAMVLCDEVQMLSGWEGSRGAKIEHYVALHMGIPIHYPRERTEPRW